MREIPMGGYVQGESFLHKADSLAKLLCTGALLVAVVNTQTFVGYGALLVAVTIGICLSGIGIANALAGIRQLWLFFLFVLFMNTAFFAQQNILWQWWIFRFSLQGAVQGCNVVLHIVFAMLVANLLVATTTPLDISAAMECVLFPLGYLQIPTRDVAVILGISIQFIPTFAQEVQTLKKAQIARGARLESKKLTEKARCILPLVIPVFVAAFRRADELALAMEARGYRGGAASRRPEVYWNKKDIVMVCFSTVVCVMGILL